MTEMYLPESAPDWVEAHIESDFEIRGWCVHCGADRLMVNGISRPCGLCGSEFGLVAGPESHRPPRPVQVAIPTPDGHAHQQTLFDQGAD